MSNEFQIVEGLSALLHWCDERGKTTTESEKTKQRNDKRSIKPFPQTCRENTKNISHLNWTLGHTESISEPQNQLQKALAFK